VVAYLDRVSGELGKKFPDGRVSRRGEVVEFTLSSDLLFGVGKDEVKPAARQSLAGLADILKRYPETLVTIEGHTDSSGTAESNQELSERRARRVFDALCKTVSTLCASAYAGTASVSRSPTTRNRKGAASTGGSR
jgi:outer membrane protein OmpA-like peptidoglycan-associated protein